MHQEHGFTHLFVGKYWLTILPNLTGFSLWKFNTRRGCCTRVWGTCPGL